MIEGTEIASDFNNGALDVIDIENIPNRSARSINDPLLNNRVNNCPINCTQISRWKSLDTSLDGTGDHENFPL